MNSIAPSIAESFDLLRFAGNVFGIAVLHVATGCRPLKVGIKFNAIRRIKINALNLAAQSFTLGQRSHHLKAVAQNHAVGPVLIVLIEIRFGGFRRYAVEIGKKVGLCFGSLFVGFSAAQKIVNQNFGVNFFLNVKRRNMNNQLRPVLLVLAAPDNLRIEVAISVFLFFVQSVNVARIFYFQRVLRFFLQNRLKFGGRYILPLRFIVRQSFDCFVVCLLCCHLLYLSLVLFPDQLKSLTSVIQFVKIQSIRLSGGGWRSHRKARKGLFYFYFK